MSFSFQIASRKLNIKANMKQYFFYTGKCILVSLSSDITAKSKYSAISFKSATSKHVFVSSLMSDIIQ